MPRVKPSRATASTTLRMKDRPGRWKLVWRRQRPRLRPALAVMAVFGVGLAATGAVHALGAGANFRERLASVGARMGLKVTRIVVEGQNKTPDGLLRAALGVHAGDPILAFSLADARARLETINWVKSATVERRLPGTVVVQLTERSPFAVWQTEGRFVLIDRTGDVVTDSDVAAFSGQLPLVVGVGAPAAAQALMDALATQPALRERVTAAVRVGERRWNLRMNNGADVLLPEGAEVRALAKLAELQNSLALLDRPLQVVDLRLPDRLVLRPQPEKPEKTEGRSPQPPRKT